jgi:hypothetical protein
MSQNSNMAYTLSDHFRSLRMVLRLNGILVDLTLGLLLLLTARSSLMAWGMYTGGLLWPTRLAGAALLSLGLLFILAANQETVHPSVTVALMLSHGLLALVLLVAYLQQEMAGLPLMGRLLLILVFVLALAGAVIPIRYLRT